MTSPHRIREFDTWRPKYGSATVSVFVAGTTTLADLFEDEALSVAAANPQTLETFTDADGRIHGKFVKPVYTASPYYLDIDSIDQTGIERPAITTLVGEDASKATVKVPGQTKANELEDIVVRVIHANNYGTLSTTDGATNNTLLTAAIGAAAALGGGFVVIPAGTWPFTTLTLPTSVVLIGDGRGVTTLTSQTADDVITLGGDRAGLMALTLDGVDLQTGSTGVFAKAKDETVFSNAEVKRFETGLHFRGGRLSDWFKLYVSTCGTGAKLHGDSDATGGADGAKFEHNRWVGGKVDLCTSIGIDLSYEDLQCIHNTISVAFENNLVTALRINGAQYSEFPNCLFTGNTTNLAIQDDADVVDGDPNKVIGARFLGGLMSGGAATFTGKCQDVLFDAYEFKDVDFTLTLPQNAILLRDSTEDSLVTIAGDGTKLTRIRSINDGASSGITTNASATKAWSIELEPGQLAYLEAVILGNQRDGLNLAHYKRAAKCHRPGSALDYDTQTANFTVGQIVTGQTSDATARIIADSDSGATGTLTLRDISGEFENNETITDPLGGSALANGTLTAQDCIIDQADTIGTDHEDDAAYNAAFAANGSEIELRVTGKANETVEWKTRVTAVVD